MKNSSFSYETQRKLAASVKLLDERSFSVFIEENGHISFQSMKSMLETMVQKCCQFWRINSLEQEIERNNAREHTE